jgi:outer membrane protein assembly factor BamB
MNGRCTLRATVTLALVLAGASGVAAAERREEVSASSFAIRAQATHEREPLWRLPLAGALVEDMQLLTPDRLLIALRSDATGLPNLHLALVDARTGVERWRFVRKNTRARWDAVLVDSVSLVYRVDEGKKVRLVCIATGTGALSWEASLDADAVPLANRRDGALLVTEPSGSHVTLRYLSLADGKERWKLGVRAASKDASPSRPVFADADVLQFYRGVERLAAADGHVLWSRADLSVPDGAPDARLDRGTLFVVTAAGALAELDAATGETRHLVGLPGGQDWDAVEPLGGRVYVRGSSLEGGTFLLAAVDREAGRVLWTHATDAPPMSNVVEAAGRAFYATSGTVVALDQSSGIVAGRWVATNASRPYPVHLRRVGKNVVFIGELMSAAFDARTGLPVWSQGWSPISNIASLVALDASLPRLREQLAAFNGKKPPAAKTGTDASFARMETARFQNMAADYSRRAEFLSASAEKATTQNERKLARLGVQIERSSAANAIAGDIALTRMNASFAKDQAFVAFNTAMIDLAVAMYKAKLAAVQQTEIDRQVLLRRSVLGSYGNMEDLDFVYRPGMSTGSSGGSFVAVTMVNLANGHTSKSYLSPTYRDYGLWTLVDFDRGVAYHHGIGMDPDRYRFLPPREIANLPTSLVGNYLIAVPINVPE